MQLVPYGLKSERYMLAQTSRPYRHEWFSWLPWVCFGDSVSTVRVFSTRKFEGQTKVARTARCVLTWASFLTQVGYSLV